MEKEDVAHIYDGILLSHKRNEIELSVVRWMDLESVIQSEVHQKDKNKYRMLTIYMECKKKKEKKMVMKNLGGKTGIKTQTY